MKRENPKPAPPPPRRRKRGRIVLSLTAVLFVVGMGPLFTVVWQLVSSNREALKTSHQENQLALANSLSYEIGLHLDSARRSVGQLGASIAHGGVTPSAREFERMAVAQADGNVRLYAFRDTRNRVRTHAPEAPSDWLEPVMIALSEQSSAVLAAESPEAIETRPRRSSDSQVLILRTEPVFRDGRLLGTVSAVLDLRGIWDDLIAHHRSPHGLLAVDPLGEPIFATDPRWLEPGNGMIRSALVGRFLESRGRSTETTLFEVDVGAERRLYLGSFDRTEEGWGLLVIAPESQVYLPVQRLIRNTWTVAFLAMAAAILIAVFFAGSLSRPIERLTAASRAFASGDFSSRVAVRSNNEIGELADTFNGMAEDIQRYIRDVQKAAEENHDLFLGTIRALAQAIDAKDPYTRGHSARVNKYSVVLARYLGLSKQEIRDIHISSLLHDVGKIGIDDAILKKPGRLTDDEFEEMKTHAALGANIMAPIKAMARILPGLRWHHERMNGSGYPDGLAGERIPRMARIIAVADSFDAMTTNRPYQRPMPFPTSAARINELSGTHFDARVVDAFNRAFEAGEFSAEEAEQKRLSEAEAARAG